MHGSAWGQAAGTRRVCRETRTSRRCSRSTRRGGTRSCRGKEPSGRSPLRPALRAGGRLRVVVGPAAGLARKAWPPDSFGTVVDALGRRGGDVLVVGARREEELVRRVASRSPHAVARADLDLRQTFAAVAAADLI